MRITPLIRRLVSASLAQLVLTSISFAALTSADIGLAGDGVTDDTAALQKALGEGSVEIVFAPGIYLLSTIDLPSRVTLRGEPGARIRINANRLSHYYTKASPQRPPNITDGGPATVGLRPSRTIPWAQWSNPRPLFAIRGDNVTLRDLEFDFTLIETLTTDEALPGALIMADGYSRLTFKGLVAERPEFAPPCLWNSADLTAASAMVATPLPLPANTVSASPSCATARTSCCATPAPPSCPAWLTSTNAAACGCNATVPPTAAPSPVPRKATNFFTTPTTGAATSSTSAAGGAATPTTTVRAPRSPPATAPPPP